MRQLGVVSAALAGALVGLYAVGAVAAGETWNPVSASQGRVPLPNASIR